jgi:hypothetical protein
MWQDFADIISENPNLAYHAKREVGKQRENISIPPFFKFLMSRRTFSGMNTWA